MPFEDYPAVPKDLAFDNHLLGILSTHISRVIEYETSVIS